MTCHGRHTKAARRLGEELLEDLPPRLRHVEAVSGRASELAAGLAEVDRDAVVASAWVHDIGYAPRLATTGLHALDGARHLADLGFPPVVVGLVAFHTGAVWEADERGLLDALSRFEAPPGHQLDTLTAADLSVGPDGDRVDPADRIEEILARYEPQHPVHRAVLRSAPELLAAVERTESRLRAAGS